MSHAPWHCPCICLTRMRSRKAAAAAAATEVVSSKSSSSLSSTMIILRQCQHHGAGRSSRGVRTHARPCRAAPSLTLPRAAGTGVASVIPERAEVDVAIVGSGVIGELTQAMATHHARVKARTHARPPRCILSSPCPCHTTAMVSRSAAAACLLPPASKRRPTCAPCRPVRCTAAAC